MPVRKTVHVKKTNLTEKILLTAIIMILPLENHLPTVGGFSALFLLFAVLGMYVLAFRFSALMKVVMHPICLSAYALILVGFIIESSHPYPTFSILSQFGQMVFGGILVASVCRDREALQWGFYGYIAAGVWMAVVLFLTSYGALSGVSASNFQEADKARNAAFEGKDIEINLNTMARISGQGTVVAFALALVGGSIRKRNILFGIAAFCFIATFLPMSRSGLLAVIMAVSAILLAFGLRAKVIVMGAIFSLCVVIVVPDAVLSRMAFSTEKSRSGKVEARARIYSAALDTFDQYALVGVGSGNFWGPWGMKTNFKHPTYFSVVGPHNSFIATIIYWGIPGLLCLLMIVYQGYRCIPRKCGKDPLSLCVLGVSVTLLIMMMGSHRLYAKELSLGIGLLIASQSWIWQQRVVSSIPHARRKLKVSYSKQGVKSRLIM
ncbi:O-antigen ligase family protein [Candidatus Nitronereus thalassa]|uniref:O-antigen ligase family protein n=1 Tax=Candidatus Nitronereus thalassa TaxID=3020898 RepID=A0ABU3K594_9BACT|nr:O-antigen ligase family protein [Candidatus Nitronereus thalassa]MDT7041565.1 O-antigen ligase family protein [Candidatus Nitronereus thalassa]